MFFVCRKRVISKKITFFGILIMWSNKTSFTNLGKNGSSIEY